MQLPLSALFCTLLCVQCIAGENELIYLETGDLPEGYNGQMTNDSHVLVARLSPGVVVDEFFVMAQSDDLQLETYFDLVLHNLTQVKYVDEVEIKLDFHGFSSGMSHILLCLVRKEDAVIRVFLCNNDEFDLVAFREPTHIVEFVLYPNATITALAQDGEDSRLASIPLPPPSPANVYRFTMEAVDDLDWSVQFTPGFIATRNYDNATTSAAPDNTTATATVGFTNGTELGQLGAADFDSVELNSTQLNATAGQV